MKLTATTPRTASRASRRSLAFTLVLCGVASSAGIGSASAGSADEGVPSFAVKYSPASLATDHGAQVLYRRIVAAAEIVCPRAPGSFLVTEAVQKCRAQSIARAVRQINDPRLVQIQNTAARKG